MHKFTKSNVRLSGSIPESSSNNIVRAYLKISLQGTYHDIILCLKKSIKIFVSCTQLCIYLKKELSSSHTTLKSLKTLNSLYSWIPCCIFVHVLIFIFKYIPVLTGLSISFGNLHRVVQSWVTWHTHSQLSSNKGSALSFSFCAHSKQGLFTVQCHAFVIFVLFVDDFAV